MNFFSKIIGLIIVTGVFFTFILLTSAATLSFDVQPRMVASNNVTLTYTAEIFATESEIRTECGGTNPSINWDITNINDSSVSPFVEPNISKDGGSIPASFFLANNSKKLTNTFRASNLVGGTADRFELNISCGIGSNQGGKIISRSSVISITLTGQATGYLDNFKFDAQPRNLDPGTSANFNFSLLFTGNQKKVESKCGTDPIVWQVYKFLNIGDHSYTQNNEVSGARGAINTSEFGSGNTVSKNVSTNVSSPGGDFVFVARVACANGNQISVSSPVSVTSGGRGSGGCGTPGQPACKSGETQTYDFDLTKDNPLKGGADDFSELVKIIAQWIFNLAIPIAVAMIVYAGILFLISAGDTSKVTKARQVLTYAVVGLAIILIGNGFVALIQSILELGGTGQETQQEPNAPEGPDEDYGPPAPGTWGNKCSRDRDCFSGLKCKNTICQRPTGNLVGEPCNGGASCDVGLACDATSDGQQVIDGQILGTCFETSAEGGRMGDTCQKDSNCISGLKCNQICQRKDGNLNGEVCLKTSNPSNCQSKACHTVGTAITGDCVPYSGR